MNSSQIAISNTVKFGDNLVPIHRRDWTRFPERLPYKKIYRMKPGDLWQEAELTNDQWQHYVFTPEGPIPVGAAIIREFLDEGAEVAVFTECWGRTCVLVDSNLVCVPSEGAMSELLNALRLANGNRWAGLPDAIAIFPDGRIAMREAKVSGKDRISVTQHSFARIASNLLGDQLDLGVVEWGRECPQSCSPETKVGEEPPSIP